LPEYVTSKTGFLHYSILSSKNLPAGFSSLLRGRAILSLLLRTALDFPTAFPGWHHRQRQCFLLPALVQTVQQQQQKGGHCDRYAQAEQQAEQKSNSDIHQAPRDLWIFDP
jgi:hypothetical protein